MASTSTINGTITGTNGSSQVNETLSGSIANPNVTTPDTITTTAGTFYLYPTVTIGDMLVSSLLVILIISVIGRWFYDAWWR